MGAWIHTTSGIVLAAAEGVIWGGQLGGQLEKSAQKVEKCHPRNLSPKNVLGKMQQVCMEATHQPSKTVFRVHETTVFRNGPGPSKVEKLIQKATLWGFILAPEVWTWGQIGLIFWCRFLCGKLCGNTVSGILGKP